MENPITIEKLEYILEKTGRTADINMHVSPETWRRYLVWCMDRIKTLESEGIRGS